MTKLKNTLEAIALATGAAILFAGVCFVIFKAIKIVIGDY